MTYNVYYYSNRVCVAHNQYGAAALFIPPVGMIVEISGYRFKVTSATFMPEFERFDIELLALGR